jgi:hypothetical protein
MYNREKYSERDMPLSIVPLPPDLNQSGESVFARHYGKSHSYAPAYISPFFTRSVCYTIDVSGNNFIIQQVQIQFREP